MQLIDYAAIQDEYLALQSRFKHQAEGLFEKTNCSSVNYKLAEYSVLLRSVDVRRNKVQVGSIDFRKF